MDIQNQGLATQITAISFIKNSSGNELNFKLIHMILTRAQ